MARYSQNTIRTLLRNSDAAATNDEKGLIFEDLVIYLFEKISGVSLMYRDVQDAVRSREFDLVFWNNTKISALSFLDSIIFTECKNEGEASNSPMGSAEVRDFVGKLRSSGASSGIIVSSTGISGSGGSSAQSVVLEALSSDRIVIMVIDRREILSLLTTDDLVKLIREKFTKLKIKKAFA